MNQIEPEVFQYMSEAMSDLCSYNGNPKERLIQAVMKLSLIEPTNISDEYRAEFLDIISSCSKRIPKTDIDRYNLNVMGGYKFTISRMHRKTACRLSERIFCLYEDIFVHNS
jgi:hypothetical protein